MKRAYAILCGLISLLLLVDRITKQVALSSWQEEYTLTRYLSFELAHNRGVSCGFLASDNLFWYTLLSGLITFFLVVFFLYTLNQAKQKQSITAHTLILAGGLSNLIDRYWYGGIIDFILVHYQDWVFPVFNVADVAIVLGVLYLIKQEWCAA